MHFTGDISLGTILTIATLLGIAIRVGWAVGKIQAVVDGVKKTASDHAMRLDRYEEALIKMVGEVQRMVGRVEGVQDRLDRWKP